MLGVSDELQAYPGITLWSCFEQDIQMRYMLSSHDERCVEVAGIVDCNRNRRDGWAVTAVCKHGKCLYVTRWLEVAIVHSSTIVSLHSRKLESH
jgi:hypothetical protein